MQPREVVSDKQAFEQILNRLQWDVGTILQLVALGAEQKQYDNTAPFWALARMMFPVAESIGDLIFGDESSSKNLVRVLEEGCEAVRAGYRGKSATVALLFRHSLTHTDELRILTSGNRVVGWQISWNEQKDHLQMDKRGKNFYRLKFDTTAFYEDLIQVLHKAINREWGGTVKSRYNSWLALSLDTTKPSATVKAARTEIASFTGICPWLQMSDLDGGA